MNPMHLGILSHEPKAARHLFFWSDPFRDGCPYLVIYPDALLDTLAIQNEWHLDTKAAPHVRARSKRPPRRFKALRSDLDILSGWNGGAEVWSTWKAFRRSKATP